MIKQLCLLTLCFTSLGLLAGGCQASPSPALFKAYELDLSQGALPTAALDGLPNAAPNASITKQTDGIQVAVTGAGSWRGYWSVGFLGPGAGYVKLNGGEHFHVDYRYSDGSENPAATSVSLSILYYGEETVQLAGTSDLTADGAMHDVEYTLPTDASTKHICAMWLQLNNTGAGTASFDVSKIWWERPYLNNSLDADKILQTPPPHDTRVQPVNGQMAITVDGKPFSGLGWTPMCFQYSSQQNIDDMDGKTGFQLARLVFTLGEQIPLELSTPSWLGPDQFDFSFLDDQLARIKIANPETKIILDVALDGSPWWVWMHPNARGPELSPAGVPAGMDAAHGIPDYLSPEWQRDSRYAIRQMVAHIQTSPYAGMVIGYQLFNGGTEDCYFAIDVTSPRAVLAYHDFLRTKYHTDAGLQAAWHDPAAKIDTASAVIVSDNGWVSAPEVKADLSGPGDFPLLFEPAKGAELADKIAYRNSIFSTVIVDFAKDIKEATQNRAITGARTGDYSGNLWTWPYKLDLTSPITEMNSPYFDMFEIQEPYFGRDIDTGSGAANLPIQGMMAHNKLVMIQNDVRPYLGSDHGFGWTPDLPTTIQMQRRIFINSMVHGTNEYLWQMSYNYDDPDMVKDDHKMEDIDQKAFHTSRDSDAQIAFVFDPNFRAYMGYDPDKSPPSRGEDLMDYPKFTWARAGVPYDTIFLDQLPKAKPYKVYVFVLTVSLTDAQRAMIESVVRKDGRTSIFYWADGLIDGQRINMAKMEDLVGMKLQMSAQECSWKMSPTAWFQQKTGVDAGYPMGTLAINEPFDLTAPDNTYKPSFVVADPDARSLATYDTGNPLAGLTGVAIKGNTNYTSLYSASPILSDALLRYVLQRAGVFSYIDTPDNCYIDHSFIGINAQQTPPAHTVHVTLPQPTALYEVFRDQELPVSDHFDIPVDKGQTYLYFRGSKAQWESLGVPKE